MYQNYLKKFNHDKSSKNFHDIDFWLSSKVFIVTKQITQKIIKLMVTQGITHYIKFSLLRKHEQATNLIWLIPDTTEYDLDEGPDEHFGRFQRF